MRYRRQVSDTFWLGAILAVAGGFLDAYTYVARGQVFSNAQTGNIVLLGLNFVQGRPRQALGYLIPILAFACGVVVAEAVRRRFASHPSIHWRQIVLLAEIAVLVFAAFLPQGRPDVVVNVAVSFISSMQVEAFRKMNGGAFATTMCTGNLRSGTELLYRSLCEKDRGLFRQAARYYGIILFFIGGAAAGVLLTQLFAEKSVLLCCIPLLAAFFAMFWGGHPGKRDESNRVSTDPIQWLPR